MVQKNFKDNSFKEIFGNSELFCEFIQSFLSIEILKDITPEDIEDISERFITNQKENRDSDTSQIGYSQSASLLAHNLIAALQLVSRGLYPD